MVACYMVVVAKLEYLLIHHFTHSYHHPPHPHTDPYLHTVPYSHTDPHPHMYALYESLVPVAILRITAVNPNFSVCAFVYVSV